MKPDKTFFSVLVTLIVLSTIFFVIERIAGRGRNRVQPIIRKGWFTDVVYWFATILLTKPFVRMMLILPVGILILAKVTSIDVMKMGTYSGYGLLSRQPIWLQAIQIYVLVDFTAYWTHRLFHRGKWWPFHAVHHSSEDLDWLGSLRVHPVNDLVNKLAQVTPVLLMGYNPTVTLSTAPILTFYAIFLHANVNWDFGPLRRCFIVGITRKIGRRGTRTSRDCFRSGTFCLAPISCQRGVTLRTSAFASLCRKATSANFGNRSHGFFVAEKK